MSPSLPHPFPVLDTRRVESPASASEGSTHTHTHTAPQVLFQRDPRALYDTPLADGKLLQTSCAMYTPTESEGNIWLNLSYAQCAASEATGRPASPPRQHRGRPRLRYTYSQTHFIGSISRTAYESCNRSTAQKPQAESPAACAPVELEPLLISLRGSINGGTPSQALRNQLAWNFGVALLPLTRWREQRLEGRVTRWFEANSKHRLFAPDSVASGLGLPYLLLADAVGCWPEVRSPPVPAAAPLSEHRNAASCGLLVPCRRSARHPPTQPLVEPSRREPSRHLQQSPLSRAHPP